MLAQGGTVPRCRAEADGSRQGGEWGLLRTQWDPRTVSEPAPAQQRLDQQGARQHLSRLRLSHARGLPLQLLIAGSPWRPAWLKYGGGRLDTSLRGICV